MSVIGLGSCLCSPLPVGFYAGLNLIAWVMIFCFVRETKQLTLEELDREYPIYDPTDPCSEVFSVPTSEFISYESKVWLPWFIKRYILFNRGLPKPPPIIERAKHTDDDDSETGIPSNAANSKGTTVGRDTATRMTGFGAQPAA